MFHSWRIRPTAIPVIGGYNVKNALIAIGIGRQLGIAEEKIKAGLAHFQLTKNRTQWLKAANGARYFE
jgi:UDP-N-acetylmuramoyl-tripeptide--D-alanyl-D-alanine ligase